VSILGVDAVHNEAIISIYPFCTYENIIRNYLFKMLPFLTQFGDTKSAIKGNTLNSGSLDCLLIPLPSLNEQKRIVAKIEEVFAEIDAVKDNQEALDKLKSGLKNRLLDLAIQGKLVPQDPSDEPASELLKKIQAEKTELIKQGKIKKDKQESYIYKGQDNRHYEKCGTVINDITDEIPFEIPDSWQWVRLGSIAFITKLAGFEYTKYISTNLSNSGIPLFKGKNIQDGQIIYNFEAFIPKDISDFLIRSQVNGKCLLTPYVGTIGNIAIHERPGQFHLGSNVGKIELYNKSSQTVLEKYVLCYLKSSYGYKELTKYKKATAQESISIEAIREVLIPLLPIEEQKRIVEKIEQLNKYIDNL
jgi:type I restriction enzyme S subunit